MMLMSGLGLMAAAAAMPVPNAQAVPAAVSRRLLPRPMPLPAPTFSRTSSTAPWVRDPIRRSGQCRAGRTTCSRRSRRIYRDDRRNVFLDGNSNLVLLATRDFGGQYYSGKLRGNWRGMINTTWEARIKLDCLTTGAWPAFWAVNEDPLPDGEVDIFEWYGNGNWAPGTTVHAASNGKTWEGKSIPGLVDGAWHTWRMRWDQDGFKFWRDYVDGAEPYFSVPPKPIQVSGRPDDWRWPFNNPGYWLSPMFTLAVGGPGGGDPALGNFPAAMLIDYIRVW